MPSSSTMALSLSTLLSSPPRVPPSLQSQFTPNSLQFALTSNTNNRYRFPPVTVTCTSSSPFKLVRCPKLDKHVVKQNRIRFVRKLITLLLSKPKHFMPIHILCKCRSYLALPKPKSLLFMIRRYPTIFELFAIPSPPTPINAAGSLTQLCVRLTPAAAAVVKKEIELKERMSVSLAEKLQKLLMLASPYNRLILSKLVHLAPDLGLPVNFRSRLCNDHPDKFKVVNTSYGRALELVTWDPDLAKVFPLRDEAESRGLIVDRPLKFKHLRLRKGLNVKRHHHEYLIRFREAPEVCPYNTNVMDFRKESMEAEKRACAVVREVLGMTVEKRTLVDHLTHFRMELGLSNKVRGMLVRHPEMFYVSLKGLRDSVFLVEGYNDKGVLVEKDKEMIAIKDELMELVRQGKRMRREERKKHILGDAIDAQPLSLGDQFDDEEEEEYEDGLDDLFHLEDWSSEDEDDKDDESADPMGWQEKGEFWVAEQTLSLKAQTGNGTSTPW